MFAAIRQIFLKGGDIKDAITYVFKATGNMPTKSEGMRIINMYQDVQKNTGKVVEFPKDRITPFYKPRPGDVKKNVEEVYFDNPEDPRLFKPDTKKPLFKDSPEAIEKIKSNNKDAVKRLRERKLKEDIQRLKDRKKTYEDFSDDGDFDPGGMASGGIARLGYVGGKLVKGASWFIKNLRQAYDELIAGKAFTNIDPMKREQLKFEILAQIKQLEQGNPIPKDMLTYMRKDKRFKDMTKTRSTDPELYDVEEVLLNPDVDQLKDIKKLEQKEMLEQFDVTGRKKNASGGIAGQLHLNQGGRAKFQMGGMDPDYDIDSMRDPFAPVPDYLQNLPTYDFGGQYYKNNPSPYGMDVDKFKAAYAHSQGMGDKVSVNPEGQILTDFGSWDPSNTYGKYVSDYNRIGDMSGNRIGKFYDYERYGLTPDRIAEMKKEEAIMNAMYGAAGRGDPRDKPGYNEARMRGFKPEPVAETPVAKDNFNLLDFAVPGHSEAMYEGKDSIVSKAPSIKDYHIAANADLSRRISDRLKNIPVVGDVASLGYDVVSPALSYPVSMGYDALQAKQRMEPGSGIKGFAKAFMDESPFSAAKYRSAGVSAALAERIKSMRNRGIDERMARSYKENIQAMADPRMNAPMGAAKGGLAKILGV